MKAPGVDRLLRLAAQTPGVISFAGGLPAPETFPRVALAHAAEAATLSMGAQPLQYDWPEGRSGLRELIAKRLKARGVHVDVEDVHITNGAQDALSLALEVTSPREVHVDHATYPGALEVFAHHQVAARASISTAAWYVMPAVHNPWGWTMAADRRALALRAEVIFEDDAYADLCFDNPTPRPLLADAPTKTFSMSTFSKTVSPGLRVGWLVAPPQWRARLRDAKAQRDVQANGLAQAMIERLLREGGFEARLGQLRSHYRARCERLLELLPRLHGIRFGLPEGGFSVWVETENCESDERLLQRALAKGVAFDPGSMFRAEQKGPDGTLAFRLSFSAVPMSEMREGIARLAAALREARANKRRVAA